MVSPLPPLPAAVSSDGVDVSHQAEDVSKGVQSESDEDDMYDLDDPDACKQAIERMIDHQRLFNKAGIEFKKNNVKFLSGSFVQYARERQKATKDKTLSLAARAAMPNSSSTNDEVNFIKLIHSYGERKMPRFRKPIVSSVKQQKADIDSYVALLVGMRACFFQPRGEKW